jgi:uncharacterized DUF497 family protein
MSDRFDPAEDMANQAKHGLPLIFGDEILKDGNYRILPTIRLEDEEERFKLIGMVRDRLFTAVFVWRGDLPRYISVRRSNNAEERVYRNPG